jgi:membrane protease subunit HflK
MPEAWDDPEEEIRDLMETLRNRFRSRFAFPVETVLAVSAGLLVLVLLLTSAYTVKPEEKAVILRFGRFASTEDPGLHFRLPFGVDQVIKVPTERVQQEHFGFEDDLHPRPEFTGHRQVPPQEEASMLTGDLNVAQVEWIVQYKISDPRKYLFNTRDPVKNLRDVSQSMLRRVVGDRLVTDVLTTGRVEIAAEAQRLTQEVLDRYDMGVRIVTVKLQDVNPPEAVRPAFNEVNAAKQEQEQAINQAEREYNQVIPEAKGKAEQTIRDAQGYAMAAVNHAKGDADRFRNVLKAYQASPNVTRTRMYFETMEELYSRLKQMIVVDKDIKGILPVFQSLGLQEPALGQGQAQGQTGGPQPDQGQPDHGGQRR